MDFKEIWVRISSDFLYDKDFWKANLFFPQNSTNDIKDSVFVSSIPRSMANLELAVVKTNFRLMLMRIWQGL